MIISALRLRQLLSAASASKYLANLELPNQDGVHECGKQDTLA